MADTICKALRDGALEGEQVVSLTIKDTTNSPFGHHFFSHVLLQLVSFILSGQSQSCGIVVIAFTRSPLSYVDVLKRTNTDGSTSKKWIRILDCYTDPLGWKDQVSIARNEQDTSNDTPTITCLLNNVQDFGKLWSLILQLGDGFITDNNARFSIAIDSVTEMLRHASISTVAALLNDLRSYEKVSSMFWLLHSDHHDLKVTRAIEYLSTMVASMEPLGQFADAKTRDFHTISWLQKNYGKGKLLTRVKRRNGRVRIMLESFHVQESSINFSSISLKDEVTDRGLVPKVQFSLHLTEKEKAERADVVLPFEHQGKGEGLQIYDGRRSSTVEGHKGAAGKSEIVYFRDSDDELPDSGEDPDDDLDI